MKINTELGQSSETVFSKPIFGVEKRSPGEMAIRIGRAEHILSCEDAALLGEILTGMANKHISDLGTRKKRVNP